jgi:2-hydroxychromene-2-carboxylate isomerase
MTMAAALDFYFDFASPYGYFASLSIDERAARHGRRVVWRPILLGAVFKVTGMRAVVEQPLRGDYLHRDVARIARLLKAPLKTPPVVPVNALAASRACWWLYGRDPEESKALARALYHATWGEGRDIAPAAVVAEVATGIGIDADAVMAGMHEQSTKDRLRDETEKAIARGVFGSPFVFVDDEPFWGWDRLDMVERWMVEGGW